MPDDLKSGMMRQMLQIGPCAGEEIVQADDFMAVGQQSFAQMGTEETSPPCHH